MSPEDQRASIREARAVLYHLCGENPPHTTTDGIIDAAMFGGEMIKHQLRHDTRIIPNGFRMFVAGGVFMDEATADAYRLLARELARAQRRIAELELETGAK